MPALEIDLLPIAPTTGDMGSHLGAPRPGSPHDRRGRRLTIAAVIAVAAIVVVTLNVVGDDEPDPKAVTPAATSPTLQTLGPNLLGTASTGLLLWSFDSHYHLQVLDLDSGELRPLGVRGGFVLFPLYRNVVVFDGDNGSSIVSATGATATKELGKGFYPVVDRDARRVWVLSDDAPRRWQQHAVDGTVLDVLPFDGTYSVVPYSDLAVLLVSAEGTSLFDLVSRQRKLLTPTRVFAAGGPNMIGRTCADQRCTFTVIDTATLEERVLLSDVPVDDAWNAMLSPDGDYLAISRTNSAFGRRAEIVAVSTGAALWQSLVGVVSSTSWSWSPDSRWLFLVESAQQVLAVDMRTPWVRTEIALPLAPLHGLASTYR
jgi:hypothetical protein